MLRQYFMGLRTVGQWKDLSPHWQHVVDRCQSRAESGKVWQKPTIKVAASAAKSDDEPTSQTWQEWFSECLGWDTKPMDDDGESDNDEPAEEAQAKKIEKVETELLLMRKFFSKWATKAGVHACLCDSQEDCSVDWTRVIAPVLEGRIKMVG
jgi:5'-nucleotidase